MLFQELVVAAISSGVLSKVAATESPRTEWQQYRCQLGITIEVSFPRTAGIGLIAVTGYGQAID